MIEIHKRIQMGLFLTIHMIQVALSCSKVAKELNVNGGNNNSPHLITLTLGKIEQKNYTTKVR
jgi:hypothetical protein